MAHGWTSEAFEITEGLDIYGEEDAASNSSFWARNEETVGYESPK